MLARFKLVFIIITLLIAAFLSSCQSGTEEPKIKFSSGSKELNTLYYGDISNERQEDIENRLKDFMIGKRFIDLPTIEFNEIIKIEALNFATNEFEIYDYILDEKANIIYNYKIEPTISRVKDNNTDFIFKKSELVNYLDYSLEGKVIHALLIRSKIDKSSFAFATLILSENDYEE